MANIRIQYGDKNSTVTKTTHGDNSMNDLLQHHPIPDAPRWCEAW